MTPSATGTLAGAKATCHRLWFAVVPLPAGQIPVYVADIHYFLTHGWSLLTNRLFPELRVILVGPATGG